MLGVQLLRILEVLVMERSPISPTLSDRVRDCCRVMDLLFYTLFWVAAAGISVDTTHRLATDANLEYIGPRSFAAAAILCALLAAKNLARSASYWGIFESVWHDEEQVLRTVGRPALRPMIASAFGAGASVVFFLASKTPVSDSATGLPSGTPTGYTATGALLLLFCGLHALLYYALAPIQDPYGRGETLEEARNTALVFLVAVSWPFLPLAILVLVGFELVLIHLPKEGSRFGGLISFVVIPVCVVLVLATSTGLMVLLPSSGTTVALYGACIGIAFLALLQALATMWAAHWTPVYGSE